MADFKIKMPISFGRLVKILVYFILILFAVNRWVARPVKESVSKKPKLDIPAYISESQDPRALVVGGKKFAEEGKLELAAVAFERASTLDPKFRDAFLFLGITRTQLKQYFEAELALRRARAIDPLYGKTYEALANLYDVTGRKDDAAQNRTLAQEFTKK